MCPAVSHQLHSPHRRDKSNDDDRSRGDLEALPIDDATCDAAMIVLVLSYLSEPQKAIAEAARILKPGGKAVIVDLLPHDRDDFRRQMEQQHAGFALSLIDRWLGEAGLTKTVTRELPPEANVKGPGMFVAVGRA